MPRRRSKESIRTLSYTQNNAHLSLPKKITETFREAGIEAVIIELVEGGVMLRPAKIVPREWKWEV